MFENKRFGLEQAVLNGSKTMTRRLVGNRLTEDDIKAYQQGKLKAKDIVTAHYKIGEVVAIAQSYKDAGMKAGDSVYKRATLHNGSKVWEFCKASEVAGWENKMFVLALAMPHRIRITDIKIERLHDISDDDCFREGIIPITWRQHLKQDWNDFTPQKVVDHHVYSLEKFRNGIEDAWADSEPDEYIAESPSVAFAALIIKMMGKKVWEENPYVFAYSFELVKQQGRKLKV